MANELVDRMAILVEVRRFLDMGATNSRSLRSDTYVRLQHFVRRSTCVSFRRFWGMCGDNSCNVFMLLFMVLWVHIFARLCRRVVLLLWHAILFSGLRPAGFSPPYSFFLGGFHCLFL
jgi:small-conductance mechanosensitive channel